MSNYLTEMEDFYANRKSPFLDDKGKLKDGYSYDGGPGSFATGTVVQHSYKGGGPDGLHIVPGNRTVYQTGAPGVGNGNGDGEDPRGFPRNTGDFDDIIGALGDDVAAANARADEYANKATQDIADNTQVLSDQFTAQLAELTAGFTERYGALEDLLATQQNSMTQFQTMMQGQMQAAQNSYNQQMAMMQNMQRSRVPEAEENAFSAQVGDQREDTSRQKENNRLSDLSILSGLGTASSPTAGLSLA